MIRIIKKDFFLINHFMEAKNLKKCMSKLWETLKVKNNRLKWNMLLKKLKKILL